MSFYQGTLLSGQPAKFLFLTIFASLITTGTIQHSSAAGPAKITTKISSQATKNVHGLWRTHKGELVRFYKCGRGICGKLVAVRSASRKDTKNKNPKLRNRSLKGLVIIRSRTKTGPKTWKGTVYNIDDGKTYHGSLKLLSPRRAKLTGCDGAFCESATWHKISKTRLAGK